MALNHRQRQFVRLYLGDSSINGNGTRCYMAAYSTDNEIAAQRSASRLLKREHVRAIIDAVEAEALDQLQIDANYVKAQSLRLYARAMGDEPFEYAEVQTDPDTGADTVTVTSRREYDPATATKALQMIGQHKDIQAFTQTIEHNHTHHLEQRLAARSKAIEGRAQVLDDPAQVGQLVDDPGPGQGDPAAQVGTFPPFDAGDHHNDADTVGADTGGRADTAEHTQAPKRVHAGGGQEERAHAREETSSERAGA